MLERLSRTKRNIALALIGLLALWFLWTVRAVLNPLLLAYLLAFIAHPLVLRLEARGWTRMKAVNFIYVACIVLTLLIGTGIFVQGSELVDDLATSDINLIDNLDESFEMFVEKHGDAWYMFWAPEVEPDAGRPFIGRFFGALFTQLAADEETKDAGKQVALDAAAVALRVIRRWFGGLMAFVSMLVLLPIYTWYLLFELERIHAFVRGYIPTKERARVTRIARRMGEVLSGFFRGRLVVCFLKGLTLSLLLWIVGVPYALFLGMASGFAALIPFFGAFLGFVFTFLIALVGPEPQFLWTLVRVIVVFSVAEFVEGYVLIPKILGDSLGLHPLGVFVAIFIGGATLGMFGFLIALPLAAAGLILVRELVLPALHDFAEEDCEEQDMAGEPSAPAPPKRKAQRAGRKAPARKDAPRAKQKKPPEE
jgi:predicted PurR-regulated permease PerM